MGEPTILSFLGTTLTLYLAMSVPPLLAALIVGFVVGLLQATTQIQDQTMPQTFKLAAVIGVLILMAPLLVAPLVSHAERVFTDFPALTR